MNQLLERERNRGMNFLNHQIITVIESASDFFTGRLTKKERKGTNASEVLFDLSLADYRVVMLWSSWLTEMVIKTSIERQVIPNQTLRGFDKIDSIKEELEKACPGVGQHSFIFQ
ncbi:uncharacterized protein LOC126720639 isoform X2 [Quercus robur]|uniref:uncharacterized protein LOC126720639 isoform X2 n=1 Tax=Quercus robur TaxID=38942 RepID=UPI002161670B|nr:uncharacterized protein LOC126720639 isoform X2 [Quercus robur]